MKIAVIDNFDSFVYNLIRYLKEEQCDIIIMRNNQLDYLQLDEVDGILLSPGPGIPLEAGEMMQVIKKYHQKKSILGVCLGHQALAQFFSHELIQTDRPLHGESSKINILSKDTIFKSIPSSIQVGRYHSWIVANKIKKPLICTALSQENEIMAFKHETLPLFGVQFHPESILTPEGRNIIRNWVAIIKNH